jgi:small subunit ribosomal protein S27Ae
VPGICAEEQRLLIAGHQLEDHELLEELPEECTLHLSLALLGAGKKRKKKTYTKPKKIKRKHKKVKLAVLKYYRVDQAGKVTRCKFRIFRHVGSRLIQVLHLLP